MDFGGMTQGGAAFEADGVAVPGSSVRQALDGIPWLRDVPPATRDRLARQALLHRVPAGSILFEQAEAPAFAQFLIGGNVELLGVRGQAETLIEVIQPVDLILPAAVLSQQAYLARARVLSEAHLLLIQAEAFRQAVCTDHAFCLAVLACQAAQFRRQIKHAKNVSLRSAEERVGDYLLKLVESASPGEPVRLPMEKHLIASQLAMKRETFSRAIAAVAHHGFRIDGDMVALQDADAARSRFPLDPLIDGPEAVLPLSLVTKRK